jgi:EAL and modified HD-GYP domain-containing signal transduction protein
MAPRTFLARQPIFDGQCKVVGYELLYRSSEINAYQPDADPEQATASTILHSLTTFGIDRLTRGRRGFINVTREMLLSGQVEILPPQSVVLELLEDIRSEPEILQACRGLRSKGYRLALDDFELRTDTEPLLRVADIVKVDLRKTPAGLRKRLAAASTRLNVSLLAEKVESWDELVMIRDEGFSYFQGYFYARPEMLEGRALHASRLGAVRLMAIVAQPEIDFDAAEDLFSKEVDYSYRLLRYINSAAFAVRERVKSLRQALVLLGESGIRRFASLLALTLLAADKPHELVVSSLVRARVCELVANQAGYEEESGGFFITGLFSLLDALLDQPMEKAIEELALATEIRAALLGEEGPHRHALELAQAMELADWGRVASSARRLGIPVDDTASALWDALDWARDIDGVV